MDYRIILHKTLKGRVCMNRLQKHLFFVCFLFFMAHTTPSLATDLEDAFSKKIDYYIRAMPPKVANSPSSRQIATYLLANAPSDERSRAYAAFQYVSAYFHPLPQEGITQTDCLGHSLLFKAICTAMGLKAEVIGGHDRKVEGGLPSECSHSWNAVKINGEWGLVECTWDPAKCEGGQVIRTPNAYNFLTPAKEFLCTHIPNDSKWQLMNPPLKDSEIDDLLFASSPYFATGLKARAGSNAPVLKGETNIKVSFDNPKHIGMSAELWENNIKLASRLTFCQSEGNISTVLVVFPHAGKYVLKVITNSIHRNDWFDQTINYSLLASGGVGANAGFPETLEKFSKSGALLSSPDSYYLRGGNTPFSISVPDATTVAILYNGQIFTLYREGQIFKGTVNIPPGSGQVTIAARFIGEGTFYFALVNYYVR